METNEASSSRLQSRFLRLRRAEKLRLGDISGQACSSYWTLIENRLELLNRFALEPIPIRDGEIQYYETSWGQHVHRAIRDSYERACPHETARQIRAYALGLQELFAAPAGKAPTETEQEEA